MRLKPRESTKHMDVTAKYMRGLGDPTRLAILHLLAEQGDMNVSEIVAALGDIAQARVSEHLACLKWCHYVDTKRNGRFVYYYIKDPRVLQVLQLVNELAGENAEQLASCGRIKEDE
ncbi:HTH-type transcriptional repressor CzrA [compost metagenome]